MEKWEIVHVPDKLPIPPNQQPTVDVFASIIEPKLANTLVRRLNQIAPLENYRHVKRVQKNKSVNGGSIQLSVILCLALESENQMESIPSGVLELINAHQLTPFVTKVAKYAATSKEEWDEQCKFWPTSYHPPTYSIDGITGFCEEDSQSIFNFMKVALKLATSSHCINEVVNSAVIVDPSVRQVIASACDQTRARHTSTTDDQTCARHTTTTDYLDWESKCIEQPFDVSALQFDADVEGGSCDCAHEHEQSYAGVSCLYPWKWSEQQKDKGSTCSWHPLRHAALVAIEYAAARDRQLFPGSGDTEHRSTPVDDTLSPSITAPAKRQKTHLLNDEDSAHLKPCSNGSHSELLRPYLCTGYDIFLVWEPCAMCAMALVHQRIRRIFYAFPNPNCGALGSVHRLQGEKSLNHHYAVFRVLLPEEFLHNLLTGKCHH